MRRSQVRDLERQAGLAQTARAGDDQADRLVALEHCEEILLALDAKPGRLAVLAKVLLAAVVGQPVAVKICLEPLLHPWGQVGEADRSEIPEPAVKQMLLPI